ncbi:MAG: lipoate--protein ligase family protein, partial [Planctomycetota bacterium]|nr:lipoate--protein ligase family protein [Planctomycetota bacterium]
FVLSPALALAWSESLAASDEDASSPVMGLWSPSGLAAALGLAQDPENELDLPAMRRDGVELIRRSSGGGAVLLAPGVLCWEAVAPLVWLAAEGRAGIRDAYAALNEPVVKAIGRLGAEVFPAGVSDLAAADPRPAGWPLRKVAGAAQLRRKSRVLVHGSLLVDLDPALISRYLRPPSSEPEYRAGRNHVDFCLNLADRFGLAGEARRGLSGRLARETASLAAAAGWKILDWTGAPPPEAELLLREKYLCPDWNFRRLRATERQMGQSAGTGN